METLFNPMALPILTCLIVTAVLGSLMRYPLPGARHWLSGGLLLIVGLLLYGGQDNLPSVLGIITANAAFLAGMLMLYAGSREFFGLRAPWRVMATVLVASVIYNSVSLYVYDDLRERLVVYSLIHGGICAAYTWTVWRYWPRQRPAYPYVLSWLVASAMLALNLSRALAFAFYIDPVRPATTPTNSLALAFVTLGLVGTSAFVVSLMLMAHDRLISQLENIAYRDGLTGADARSAFMTRLERQLKQPGTRPLQLVLLDLDHFKRINDTYGHACGDAVLVHFVTLLRSRLGGHDAVGRMGGEEFAVLLADAPLGAAALFDGVLRKTLAAQPVLGGGHTIRYGYSAGAAIAAPHESAAQLLARADAALYAAKRAGRGQLQHAGADTQPLSA
ncbi:GGDEF domain-containing protein [Verticiella sediminum]|uniref:diguanylate cyclase n=1 Tax=Verticiella sediminum TaxID=1247510 RepID=A0A556AC99_9BURK|nr:GGDEF domain-containing protein [Verticiella sediminum]TSH90516.1 GGDEF domain-containing protein [Verticiella sediminum]